MSDCPKCGCNDVEVKRTTRVFGAITEVMECSHCGNQFRRLKPKEEEEAKPQPEGIIHQKPCCPKCGHAKVPMYSSRKDGTRYRKCRSCGHRFKTFEVY